MTQTQHAPDSKPKSDLSSNPWNVPNALSTIRLVMAIAVCVCIEQRDWTVALILFVIAASTDWIDGWWARKFNQVTKLGRILDPFVDKVIICGAMIALVGASNSPIAPWMATLVVARELLVTSLRGLIEGQGGDFSAKQLGKWKMVLQCAAVIASLLYLIWLPDPPGWLKTFTLISIWGAILLTIASAIQYVMLVGKPTPRKSNS
jgi:CDP-diacylglycerol--glycerol-3-phosphate 3-phosphatidyltransferase